MRFHGMVGDHGTIRTSDTGWRPPEWIIRSACRYGAGRAGNMESFVEHVVPVTGPSERSTSRKQRSARRGCERDYVARHFERHDLEAALSKSGELRRRRRKVQRSNKFRKQAGRHLHLTMRQRIIVLSVSLCLGISLLCIVTSTLSSKLDALESRLAASRAYTPGSLGEMNSLPSGKVSDVRNKDVSLDSSARYRIANDEHSRTGMAVRAPTVVGSVTRAVADSIRLTRLVYDLATHNPLTSQMFIGMSIAATIPALVYQSAPDGMTLRTSASSLEHLKQLLALRQHVQLKIDEVLGIKENNVAEQHQLRLESDYRSGFQEKSLSDPLPKNSRTMTEAELSQRSTGVEMQHSPPFSDAVIADSMSKLSEASRYVRHDTTASPFRGALVGHQAQNSVSMPNGENSQQGESSLRKQSLFPPTTLALPFSSGQEGYIQNGAKFVPGAILSAVHEEPVSLPESNLGDYIARLRINTRDDVAGSHQTLGRSSQGAQIGTAAPRTNFKSTGNDATAGFLSDFLHVSQQSRNGPGQRSGANMHGGNRGGRAEGLGSSSVVALSPNIVRARSIGQGDRPERSGAGQANLITAPDAIEQWDATRGKTICRTYRACRLHNGTILVPEWMQQHETVLRETCGMSKIAFVIRDDAVSRAPHGVLRKEIAFPQGLNLAMHHVGRDLFADAVPRNHMPHFVTDILKILAAAEVLLGKANNTHRFSQLSRVLRGFETGLGVSAFSELAPALQLYEESRNRPESEWVPNVLKMFATAGFALATAGKEKPQSEEKQERSQTGICFRSVVTSNLRPYEPYGIFDTTGNNVILSRNNILRTDPAMSPAKRLALCPITVTALTRKGPRSLQGLAELQTMLQMMVPRVGASLQFQVVEFDKMAFEEQVRVMQRTDVLIAAHGAGNSNFIFMRPRASVVEVFPFAYKAGPFDGFAQVFGLDYSFIMSAPQSDVFKECLNRHESNVEIKRNVFSLWDQAVLLEQRSPGEHRLKFETEFGRPGKSDGMTTRGCVRMQELQFDGKRVAGMVLEAGLRQCRRARDLES
jgi:hypothetical protein